MVHIPTLLIVAWFSASSSSIVALPIIELPLDEQPVNFQNFNSKSQQRKQSPVYTVNPQDLHGNKPPPWETENSSHQPEASSSANALGSKIRNKRLSESSGIRKSKKKKPKKETENPSHQASSSANVLGSHCDPTHPIPSCSNPQAPPPGVHKSPSDLTNQNPGPSTDASNEEKWMMQLIANGYGQTLKSGTRVTPQMLYVVENNYGKGYPGIMKKYAHISEDEQKRYNNLSDQYNCWALPQYRSQGSIWWMKHDKGPK